MKASRLTHESLRFYDAHNHLQDDRFGGRQAELLSACTLEGVVRMVVNGSCEKDWPQVFTFARQFGRGAWHRSPLSSDKLGDGVEPLPAKPEPARAPQVIPSFGYHPWYIHERSADWQKNLVRFLDEVPSAVGEIGLDRWKPGLPYDGQEEVFLAQLRLAAERNLPVSIHCLQAWGRMLDLLKAGQRPARGFLLHSYGGPQEMVAPFADLGAYFSLPGYYAHERKERQRATFRHIPSDRLLIETDAPDQILPEARHCFGNATVYSLTEATGKRLNHPANLRAVYEFGSVLFGESIETLAARVEENFLRLFGGL